MNFADIDRIWNSGANRPSAAHVESLKLRIRRELRLRRRRFAAFLTVVFGILVLVTHWTVMRTIFESPDVRGIDPQREWSSFLMLLLPWAGALLILKQYVRHVVRHRALDRPVSECILAFLDQNRLDRTRVVIIAILHGLVLITLPLVAYQLREAGKAGDEIVIPFFVLWPAIAFSILAGLLWYYRRRLAPQRRSLEALLDSFR